MLGQSGKIGDGGGMRGKKQEKGSVRQGAMIEAETGEISPESGTGSGEKFCGRGASLFNDNNV